MLDTFDRVKASLADRYAIARDSFEQDPGNAFHRRSVLSLR